MKVREFRHLPFLQNFNINEYEQIGYVDEHNIKLMIFRHSLNEVEEGINIAEFMETDIHQYSIEAITNLISKVLDIEPADLDVLGSYIIINNLDEYVATINDYDILELDIENKVLKLIVTYQELNY